MPLHAYTLDDSARPVSPDALSSLGCKIILPSGDHWDTEQSARKLAQERGFPVTQEDSIGRYDFKEGAEHPQHVLKHMAKIPHIPDTGCSVTTEMFIAVIESSPLFDFEDVNSKSWIRAEIPEHAIIFVPAGFKFRFDLNKQERNQKFVAIALFNGPIPDTDIIWGEELESHATRDAYLNSIGQA